MNCKQAWSQKFIIQNINKSFFDNQYKKSRKQFLFESEISKLPATMPAAEIYSKVKEEETKMKNFDLKIKELNKQVKALQREKWDL